MLFGKLPDFFKNEAELRGSGARRTRARNIAGPDRKRLRARALAEMQKIIDAEKSDLFDVLGTSHTRWRRSRERSERTPRRHRSAPCSTRNSRCSSTSSSRIDVSAGVDELDQEKLVPLLQLKYHNSIMDAVNDLGDTEKIRGAFAGFQKFLYQKAA